MNGNAAHPNKMYVTTLNILGARGDIIGCEVCFYFKTTGGSKCIDLSFTFSDQPYRYTLNPART